ncbi:glycosyltransferase [Pedobacter sp. JY14-1]|uniref:glycosyltransferase n=1 Tax=Pedobacter sp. JY14-1 TaxID=3034151 RepID=UPI0023E2D457|nr:glycosyltransferase [Pedobacter sp. JY14-1]
MESNSLKGKTIVILGIAKFDGPFESTSFTTAKYLAQDNDVFYIDNPYTWKDFFALRKTEAFRIRRPYFFSGDGILSTASEKLKVLFTFPLLPVNFLPEGVIYRFFLRINERLIRSRLKAVLKARDIRDFIFINSFNFHYPGVAIPLSPRLSVYHCVDPLIVPYDRRHGIISERRLVAKSDLVICTSKQLYEEKRMENPNTYFIPNAADLAHSSSALRDDMPISPLLEGITRPIAGYFGNIERRMDFELLAEVARQNMQMSFVFAGPVSEEYIPEGFRNQKNIFFTGRLPYQEMPGMIKGFDVAMIPFKRDTVSRTIFPLKLFEYLGAGKPVVATDFNPDLVEFTGDTVAYCATPAEFGRALMLALDDNASRLAERLRIASENTWEKRLSEFSALLHSFL